MTRGNRSKTCHVIWSFDTSNPKWLNYPLYIWRKPKKATTIALATTAEPVTPSVNDQRTPLLRAVCVDPCTVIQASVLWDNTDRSVCEQVPAYYMKSTLPLACRNFAVPPWGPLAEQSQLIICYGQVQHLASHAALTEHLHQPPNQAKCFLVHPVHTLDKVVADLQSIPEDVIAVTPRCENKTWYARAGRLFREYGILHPVASSLATCASPPLQIGCASVGHSIECVAQPLDAGVVTGNPSTVSRAVSKTVSRAVSRRCWRSRGWLQGRRSVLRVALALTLSDANTKRHLPTRVSAPPIASGA